MTASVRILQKLAALVGFCGGIAGLLVFVGFVLLLGLDWLPERPVLAGPWPWVVNLGWLALFALQHSGMARQSFKRWWTRFVPEPLERSCYVACSGLALAGLALGWQPLPAHEAIWQLPSAFVVISLTGGLACGLICLQTEPVRFFGLRQMERPASAPETLQTGGAYRYVRHPLMLAFLVFLWAQPVMRPTLLMLDTGLTVYILIAIRLEERDLRARLGQAYVEYSHNVPALIPWPRRAWTKTNALGEDR